MSHAKPCPRVVFQGENMKFLVLCRRTAAVMAGDEPYVVISITEPFSDWYELNNREYIPNAVLAESEHRKDVLRLQFHDTSKPNDTEYVPITDEQAKEIVEFVKRWKSEVNLIVVHCYAGISRSSGVAAALSRWLNRQDMWFYKNYDPNRLVYNKVLKAALEADADFDPTQREV